MLKYLFFLLFCSPLTFCLAQNLKSPNDFLPHKVGEQFSAHHQIVSYFDYVAANASNIKLIRYGTTHEERPLLLAFVSSKENLANLEKIRIKNIERTLSSDSKTNKEENPVAIVWLSHTVHGNEPSGAESAMLTLYRLCSDPAAQKWLENTIVIIDPTLNPDGYDRYTSWFRGVSHTTPNPAPETREHNEPWPGGRVNHYLFDLNRDWAWQTQTETQQRVSVYKNWMPHIHADLHEQGYNNPYYFAPAAQPIHPLTTKWQNDFQTEIGNNHAKYFDANGWLYFTKEIFDLFYPSYGDTYPTFNGSIGMTYEQAGHSRGGRAISLENNDVLTLENRALHHHTTAISTIEIASQNAKKIIENFENYFKKSVTNPDGIYKTYIIKNTNAPDKIKDLCQLLDRNKIQYGAANSQTLQGYSYRKGIEERYTTSDKDLIISTFQPMSVLTQVLFDPESSLNDSLTYDITAWALPFAYGLDAVATKTKIVPTTNFVFEKSVQQKATNQKPYAYIATWKSNNGAKFLAALHQQNVRVRCADEDFSLKEKNYLRGTLVILRADNKALEEQLEKIVTQTAQKYNQNTDIAYSGLVTKGHDFGSEKLRLLKKPTVALVWSDNISENAFGHIWHHFEQDLQYPLTVLHLNQLTASVLKNYNYLILPDGNYAMDSAALERLKVWTSDGNSLLALDNAVAAFEDKTGFLLTKYFGKKEKEDAELVKEKLTNDYRLLSCDRRERFGLSDFNPGIVLKLDLDVSHPLAYGLGQHYFSLKTNGLSYQYLKESGNIGTTGETLTTFGFIGARFREKLKRNTLISQQSVGSGRIIYLTDSPLFRGFWNEGKLLFANALFLVK